MDNSLVFLSWLFVGLVTTWSSMSSQAEARAFFVFGDSLVDNGNNDYLVTTARADNYPYGIDYPTHRATGRFSNGLNIPDLISTQGFTFFIVVYESSQLIISNSKLLSDMSFQVNKSAPSPRCHT